MVKSGDMLIGEYNVKLGDKNRVALPKSFRKSLNNKLIITRGFEGCVLVMSSAQWEKLVTDEISGPFVLENIRDTTRFLLGSANYIDLDFQGRFVVPKYLIEHARIESECVFLGLGRWVELWGQESWSRKLKAIQKNISGIGNELASMNKF